MEMVDRTFQKAMGMVDGTFQKAMEMVDGAFQKAMGMVDGTFQKATEMMDGTFQKAMEMVLRCILSVIFHLARFKLLPCPTLAIPHCLIAMPGQQLYKTGCFYLFIFSTVSELFAHCVVKRICSENLQVFLHCRI